MPDSPVMTRTAARRSLRVAVLVAVSVMCVASSALDYPSRAWGTASAGADVAVPATGVTSPPLPAVVEAVPRTEVPVRPAADVPAPQGAPPVDLQIDDLELSMEVVPVGVESDGLMELPTSVSQAGWYRFGAAPGSATGTTILAAHVDSTAGIGPFAGLSSLVPGALVQVVDATGAVHGYRVTAIEQYPKATVDLTTVFDRTGPRDLVLITCGGVFDRDTGHYQDNTLVTASPVP